MRRENEITLLSAGQRIGVGGGKWELGVSGDEGGVQRASRIHPVSSGPRQRTFRGSIGESDASFEELGRNERAVPREG
jgi:hypothetical protein